MKQYYAYIRVSTTKQGEQGSSLQAQRSAIERYASQHDLRIAAWFEEQETAAKRGRREFSQMLAALGKGSAHGVIIHKIDRSARNLRDWADLGELIDRGVEVHFAHESLDLKSRGGRLSADIQAVVAADFIRNLREEVRKGVYGRLKQGLYPWPAPHGYKNSGGGKPKIIDPVTGPMVKRVFELYATGNYNLRMIAKELKRLGFKPSTGQTPSLNSVSLMLNNKFYIGIIYLRKTGETFAGIHPPLITPHIFDQVQNILNGRTKNQGLKHDYLYRKTIHCSTCNRVLIPEKQKGHIYYRCQAKACKGTCVREELLDSQVQDALTHVIVEENEIMDFTDDYEDFIKSEVEVRQQETETREMRLANIDARIARVTDAYIDRLIEKPAYEERNRALLHERARLKQDLDEVTSGKGGMSAKLKRVLELMQSLQNKENLANSSERLDMLKSISSNLSLRDKSLVIAWESPIDVLAERDEFSDGAPRRGTSRTLCSHSKLSLRHRKKSVFCRIATRLEKDSVPLKALPSSDHAQSVQ